MRVARGAGKPEGGIDALPERIFINLAVKDLGRSMGFFEKLGYGFDPQFTNEKSACMILGSNTYVMLLPHEYFAGFTTRPITDARKSTEVIVAVSADSRSNVDAIVKKALSAGARRLKEPRDHGFMYESGFEDLDGHLWEYFWMDSAPHKRA